jgi:hypothetical protein
VTQRDAGDLAPLGVIDIDDIDVPDKLDLGVRQRLSFTMREARASRVDATPDL